MHLALAENGAAARSVGVQADQIDRSRAGLAPDGRIGSRLDHIGLWSPQADAPAFPP
ncbi:MAG: hypothetical protein WCG26_06880 [Chloroflexales bacterium]